jgi:DNA-binding CsgD family transcriptional regulator
MAKPLGAISTTLDATIVAHIHDLWDRLADFDATRGEEALFFLMRELKRLAGADDAVWIGFVRMAHGEAAGGDHQFGWRGKAIVHLEWTDLKRQVVADAIKAQEVDGGVPSATELLRRAGSFRTLTLREVHDMESFTRTEHYRACFAPFGITDRMWCIFPVNADCEAVYILDRFGGPWFTERDKQTVSAALRGIKWFHRRTMLFHGVMLGDGRLTPRERSLLARLLSDSTEKEIAADLGLAESTTRDYIKNLYRKFGVRGRMGLAALWLGRPE